MKLAGAQAKSYLAAPTTNYPIILLHGPELDLIAIHRKKICEILLGPNAEQEMRFETFTATQIKSDPALLLDAITTKGFFPGQRMVLITDANDALSTAIKPLLDIAQTDDAILLLTAGSLTKKSSLRKLMETTPKAATMAFYPVTLSEHDVKRLLDENLQTEIMPDAIKTLFYSAQNLSRSELNQIVEKLSLYKLNDTTPLTTLDVAECLPNSGTHALDELVRAVAEGKPKNVSSVLTKLISQGSNPTTICLTVSRHFKRLYQICSNQDGVNAGANSLRPPVFGPMRDQITSHASGWGITRAEAALEQLLNTDAQLRSSSQIPKEALLERSLLRISMMRPRR